MNNPNQQGIPVPVPIYPDLADKVAVVTGGSRGIGAATARVLAANGVKVVVSGRDAAALEAVADDMRRQGGVALGVRADVTDFAAIEGLRRATEDAFGAADIVVAFAGGGRGRPSPVAQTSLAEWQALLEANLTATFLTLRSFLPGMIERRQGSIITMASLAGRIPTPAAAAYAAAKAGIIMLSRQVAEENGQYGIRVNCVSPSTILTETVQQQMPAERQQQWAAQHPLGRLGTPADVALTTLFLASASASWLTGLTVDVAGGRLMS
ncbi:MAG: SDR family oxidoreductase [Caldilinea sp. CFX5]|nr:SDR family oxidoreductase [Caldilinea sp. CFX5]